MFSSGAEAQTICFIMWLLGTFVIIWMGSTGQIKTDRFNAVPWSQCLKSTQHQVFVVTFMAWLLMWGV